MVASEPDAVSVDWDADAKGASPPPSRLGNYLRSRHAHLLDAWRQDGIVAFAHGVVRIAQPLVMAPGAIRYTHPAVLDVAVDRGDDGDAVGIVGLACLPALTASLPPGSATWRRRWDELLDEPNLYVAGRRQTVLLGEARLSGPISLAAPPS